jgi:replication factor A1
LHIVYTSDTHPLFLLAVDLLKPDTTVIFRNARIDMFKGTMRLAVDKWGRIEVTEPADLAVNQDNNMSMVEYELVDVAAEEE